MEDAKDTTDELTEVIKLETKIPEKQNYIRKSKNERRRGELDENKNIEGRIIEIKFIVLLNHSGICRKTEAVQ